MTEKTMKVERRREGAVIEKKSANGRHERQRLGW